MTASQGWIPLWRSFQDSPVFLETNGAELRLAVWIMLNARVEDEPAIPAGCVDASQRELSDRLRISPRSVQRAVTRLEQLRFVTAKQLPGRYGRTRFKIVRFAKWRAALGSKPMRGEAPTDQLDMFASRVDKNGEGRHQRAPEGRHQRPEEGRHQRPDQGRHQRPDHKEERGEKIRREEEGAPRAARRRRSPTGSTGIGDQQRTFRAGYDQLFADAHAGELPTWTPKSYSQVTPLLRELGPDRLLARARNMFAIEARGGLDWPKPPYDLGTLVGHPDKFASLPVNGTKRSQTNGAGMSVEDLLDFADFADAAEGTKVG